jgi:hypothetical protein
MDDLADHRIRTPLPPLQTFYDDPLRILRCLRFASRFGYALDKELTECLGDETLMVSVRKHDPCPVRVIRPDGLVNVAGKPQDEDLS